MNEQDKESKTSFCHPIVKNRSISISMNTIIIIIYIDDDLCLCLNIYARGVGNECNFYIKPQLFKMLSENAIACILSYFYIKPQHILFIYLIINIFFKYYLYEVADIIIKRCNITKKIQVAKD